MKLLGGNNMRRIIGAAIGSCVHVGGLHHFLQLAESEGYEAVSLGPAVSITRLVKIIAEQKPDIVALSYRLTPESAALLFSELSLRLASAGISDCRMIFGGTPPVTAVAAATGMFERLFDGTEPQQSVKEFLRGSTGRDLLSEQPDSLIGRIALKYPYPLLRHHFGRPTVGETVRGVEKIAMSGVLDVISVGPDQNAQEQFFRPGEMDHSQDGAGGVPLRTADDLRSIYRHSRCGNYPLVRCYAGTRDLLRWAEMSVETIKNAWGAIPLCWYSVLDGRSQRTISEAVAENQSVMRWYALKEIPVEVNESHQWSLRDAHDSLSVAMAFLAAWNARKAGVKHYVSQYMFNNPPGTWPSMDLAKMLAKNEMIERLAADDFTVIRQVRAGLANFSSNQSFAKGQLAASAVISLALRPHIVHVVGYSEGDHAIYPDELIESCEIVRGVLHNTLRGMPDLVSSPEVLERKNELMAEADTLLEAIKDMGAEMSDDPWSDPGVISRAVRTGLLDTPHFIHNDHLCGSILTGLVNGAWYAIDPETGNKITETERIEKIRKLWQE